MKTQAENSGMWHSKRRNREHGQAMVLFVLALVLVMGAAALVIDVGMLRLDTARLQNAIDAGALAAAEQLPIQGSASTASNPSSLATTALATGIVADNYSGATIPLPTYDCIVPSTAGTSPGTYVPVAAQIGFECPNLPGSVTWTCSGLNCSAPCNPNAIGADGSNYQTCNMIGVTASATQAFTFGRVFGLPVGVAGVNSGTVNGGGPGNGSATSYAANSPSRIDVVLIMDRTQSMSGIDDQNAQAAALSIVQKETYAGQTSGPIYNPTVEWLAFGMLGNSNPTSCHTSPSGSRNVGQPGAGTLYHWVPVGMSGMNAPSPAGNQASAQDYTQVVAAITCYSNSSTGTDLADPIAFAQYELDHYGHKGDRQGIILETDGQANEHDSAGPYPNNTPCANAVAAAAAAKSDRTNSSAGIQIYTIGFGLDGTNNTGQLCSESGSWNNATPRSALVAMASPGAVDDTCTTANENTPLYYNPTTQHYEYLSSTAITYTNPSGMTRVTSAPGAPWQLAPDHFFCVPKQQTSSAAMSQMLQQAASDLASGAHLVQLPQPPPIITAISPGNNGSYNAGTTVTLTGQYFSSAYAVDVGTVSVPFTALSDTVIRFSSPSASAVGVPAGGSVNVTVLNPGGTSNAATFTYP